jgi:uncharacterized protein YqeY
MALKEQIIKNLTEAMKAKDELTLSTLRMLKAEIMKYEVSGADMVATDQIVIDLIKRGIKQRNEASEGFKKGGNEVSAQKELDEIKILEKYMPAQMGEEQIKEITKAVIAEMSATPADFGKVMKAVMEKVKGQADGSLVSKAVKELLK